VLLLPSNARHTQQLRLLHALRPAHDPPQRPPARMQGQHLLHTYASSHGRRACARAHTHRCRLHSRAYGVSTLHDYNCSNQCQRDALLRIGCQVNSLDYSESAEGIMGPCRKLGELALEVVKAGGKLEQGAAGQQAGTAEVSTVCIQPSGIITAPDADDM
jgi:hypothetical protein